MTKLYFTPDISPRKTRENLSRIVARGAIRSGEMYSRIRRLADRFAVYASTSPFGLWAPGLAINGEMRALSELHLPMAEMIGTWNRFLSLSLRYPPTASGTVIHTAPSWIDALQLLQPHVTRCDPAELLRSLLEDEDRRIPFLFALFLPGRHGGNFLRYPGQMEYLRRRIGRKALRGSRVLRCLDSACATGESTYGLVSFLLENGFPPDSFLVHGSTVEPLELFSAAHGFFPHSPGRRQSFLRGTERVFERGANERMAFFAEDITQPVEGGGEGYDIILCNGLLGGPNLSRRDRIEAAVSSLGTRLKEGGMILAADRFHGGWKKLVPASLLTGIFSRCGFTVREISEGIVAEKR